jgi:hypothetical protein
LQAKPAQPFPRESAGKDEIVEIIQPQQNDFHMLIGFELDPPVLGSVGQVLGFFVAARGVHCPSDPFQTADVILGPLALVVILCVHSLKI